MKAFWGGGGYREISVRPLAWCASPRDAAQLHG